MQETDKAKFVAILKGLAAIKPGVKLTDESYEIYWLSLQEWSYEEFRKAAVHLASASEFMPNPFHFEQLRKAARPLPGEAWAKVLSFVRSAYRPSGHHLIDPYSEFDATTLHAVAAIGGFRAIAMSDMSSTPFLEKRFVENYDSMQDMQDVRQALPQIAASQCGPTVLANGLLKRFKPPSDQTGLFSVDQQTKPLPTQAESKAKR